MDCPAPCHLATSACNLKLRIFRLSGKALTYGIQMHTMGGVTLRVYSPAKTVVDCFKFRNKVGLDVAMEALREGFRKRLFTMDGIVGGC